MHLQRAQLHPVPVPGVAGGHDRLRLGADRRSRRTGDEACRQCSTARSRLTSTTRSGGGDGAGARDGVAQLPVDLRCRRLQTLVPCAPSASPSAAAASSSSCSSATVAYISRLDRLPDLVLGHVVVGRRRRPVAGRTRAARPWSSRPGRPPRRLFRPAPAPPPRPRLPVRPRRSSRPRLRRPGPMRRAGRPAGSVRRASARVVLLDRLDVAHGVLMILARPAVSTASEAK